MKKIHRLFAAVVLSFALSGCSGSPSTAVTDAPVTVSTEETPAAESSLISSESISESVSETENISESEIVTETEILAPAESETVTSGLPFEDTPENAYERLMLSFVQPDGGEIAPDDYGGVYSMFDTLYVAITTDEPGEYYTALFDGYTCISYTTVAVSFNELSRICEEAALLLDPDFAVTDYYVDVPSNKASVVISQSDPKTAQNFLKTIEDPGFDLHNLEIVMAE